MPRSLPQLRDILGEETRLTSLNRASSSGDRLECPATKYVWLR